MHWLGLHCVHFVEVRRRWWWRPTTTTTTKTRTTSSSNSKNSILECVLVVCCCRCCCCHFFLLFFISHILSFAWLIRPHSSLPASGKFTLRSSSSLYHRRRFSLCFSAFTNQTTNMPVPVTRELLRSTAFTVVFFLSFAHLHRLLSRESHVQ